jgi:diacylglycerol kinase (ATP)
MRVVVLHHVFIVNPVAGKGRALHMVDAIKARFNRFSQTYEILTTKAPQHAKELALQAIAQAKEKKESLRVYPVGGDGTLNEIINAAIGTDVELGIIPCGTGNDSSRTLYPVTDPYKLLSVLPISSSFDFDIGKANDRYFLNIASVGFDADVVMQSRRYKSLMSGSMAYLIGALSALLKQKKYRFRITIDDKPSIEKDFLLCISANGSYYGGGFKAAPDADMNDGLLDYYLVDHLSIPKILRFMPMFRKGNHTTLDAVKFIRGKKALIESDEPFPVNIDGEISSAKSISFELSSKSIKIIVP